MITTSLRSNGTISLRKIADSGQCFRMKEIKSGVYSLVSFDYTSNTNKWAQAIQVNDREIGIYCNENDLEFWRNYFDLDYDYDKIRSEIENIGDSFLMKARDYGDGIRILKQDIWETMVSFIISQRKNISSISKCIEALSERFGEKLENNRYGFPTPESIASASLEDLQGIGLGYRDVYILNAARTVVRFKGTDHDISRISSISYTDGLTELKSYKGIGDKVANCILLFGAYRINAFPIDVWIQRVLDDIYGGYFNKELYRGYAGIVQQYMFYYYKK